MISPSNWEQIRALFHTALERAPEERVAFLRAQTSDDEVLREVASLLAAHADADALLDAAGHSVGDEAGPAPSPAGAATRADRAATLRSGAQLGPYVVVSLLGAGAMGEVYRARDTNLRRDVALKILPASLAADRDRLARFTREARTLGSLNHPHIAQVHGFEAHGGVRALVMELVEGRDLAQHLARGPIAVAEALPIARQIAEALEAAHTRGIVHRDLKPANIMIREDGTVKVLDFGLAKAWLGDRGSASAPADRSATTPTLTTPVATDVGVLVGTVAYMSPEQARGAAVDKGSDIWAFGCVLYEMLTGARAFHGAGVADTLASVLERDPAWERLPDTTPPSIRVLLRRCLRKDRRERLQDAAGVRIEIDDVLRDPEDSPPAAIQHRSPGVVLPAAFLAVVAIAAIAGAAAMRWTAPSHTTVAVVTRFEYLLPDGQTFTRPGRHVLALSPDGTRLAYIANQQLYLREMNALLATPIAGTQEDPMEAVFSPDGKWLAYFVRATTGREGGGWTLKKISVAGGTPVTLAHLADAPFGASWYAGTLIFGMNHDGAHGVQGVPDSGGVPRTLITVDARTERAAQPQLLDGGTHVLFTVLPASGSGRSVIAVQQVGARERTVLVEGGTNPQLLPTGHLVYIDDGALLAMSFDAKRRTVSGSPVPVQAGVAQTDFSWAGQYAIARNGTLAFRPGTAGRERVRLMWADRRGKEVPLSSTPRAYFHPRVSPDGKRIAVSSMDEEEDIWIVDVATEGLTRLTFGPAVEQHPAWGADSRHVFFSSESTSGSVPVIFRMRADGIGTPEALTDGETGGYPQSTTRDGKSLVYQKVSGGRSDLFLLPLDGGHSPQALLADPAFDETNADISPDGQWIAYQSSESGRQEVYVRPFPAVHRGRWQISAGGGTRPVWSPAGGELMFLTSDERLASVAIQGAAGHAAFTFGPPQPLLDRAIYALGVRGRTFDVSRDGQRVLVVRPPTPDSPSHPSIVVVSNWADEVQARVPIP